ncbi:ornithine carbamoyltransferase [Halovivax asiaticus JCM 14624]|uniref:Ornithine carbamoyltransferase n=1 Tax=Halovivax asiaticus JCM 14624 TaxID=1227490 RepID=M0BM55_9EURY|nr:ornithine carbamoyltransferase [Halovivax asiaticus]ELZ11542.1 ornithine carbamoyltransferase [Halovivax asiaticus JCM 14624]
MSYQPNTDPTAPTDDPTGPNATDVTHVTDVDDLSRADLAAVLDLAAEYKVAQRRGWTHADLSGQTLGMLFEKPSTRTRVSFETGMTQLGGHAIFLGEDDIQLGNGEPIRDTARALSRYVDVVMARLFDHADLEELARFSDVPVINGLTDDAHPCQTLADLLTIRETVGPFDDVRATWVGDGNNVAQSFALGCALTGIDCTIATPAGYGVDDAVLDRAGEIGTAPTVTTDPEAAVAGADVVYTDVWVSMGQEAQRAERIDALGPYQVNESLLAAAPDDVSVMHCLPAHRGEEITGQVLEGDRSIVWQQAENRLHAQKGLLGWLQP